MKAMMSGCLAVVCATMFAACAVDSAPSSPNADTGETTAAITASDATPDTASQPVVIPPELTMGHVDDLEISGNEATTNACHVTLLFCRDPRHGNLPSFCASGCAPGQAGNVAHSLCVNVCGDPCTSGMVHLGSC